MINFLYSVKALREICDGGGVKLREKDGLGFTRSCFSSFSTGIIQNHRVEKTRGHPSYRGPVSTSSSYKDAAASAPSSSSSASPLFGVKAALLMPSSTSSADGGFDGGGGGGGGQMQMCIKSTIDMVACKGLEMRAKWKSPVYK